MKTFQFALTGFMPLLMHADNIEGADSLQAWRQKPENKNVSTPGDDRTPPWTWQTYCYTNGEHIVMPSDNIMVALRHAGAQLILKKQKTFKEASQSGLLMSSEYSEFRNDGRQIRVADMEAIKSETFLDQAEACRKMGFELYVKRVRVGTSKHIRVRPMFRKWTVVGEVMVLKPEITPEILVQLFNLAGKAGLCDWRPASKTPGWYGQFTAEVTQVD